MTNLERFRKMSARELAQYIDDITKMDRLRDHICEERCIHGCICIHNEDCISCFTDWLESEADA